MLDELGGLGRVAYGVGATVAVTIAWLFAIKVPTEHLEQLPTPTIPAADGMSLFRTHCAICHGEAGDGNGPAAQLLYPRPRDFTTADFRLITTTNQVPSDDDLMNVINRGMPSSAMMPFAHLPPRDKQTLVGHVRGLVATGMFRTAVKDATARGETPDEAALRKEIAEFLKPGPKLELPTKWPDADSASIKRGQKHYDNSCTVCHGAKGKGDGAVNLRDSNGQSAGPRDFTRGIYKGRRDRESVYARIVLGMKGVPMPANSTLKPGEVGDIVNFMNALSAKETPLRVEHERTIISARRVPGTLPEDLSDVWAATKPVPIVISPLWWCDYLEPDLRVSAIHDGKTFAIRLAWLDSTKDDRLSKPTDCDDMAAVQLFRGQPEPFLGIGANGAAIDLWRWRASGRGQPLPKSVADPAANEKPPTTTITPAAKGTGGVMFRPRASQIVTSQSSWTNQEWVVEFRRSMAAPAEAGLSLTPGQSATVSFAVWDGAFGDRNGQKKISIWHDLRIE